MVAVAVNRSRQPGRYAGVTQRAEQPGMGQFGVPEIIHDRDEAGEGGRRGTRQRAGPDYVQLVDPVLREIVSDEQEQASRAAEPHAGAAGHGHARGRGEDQHGPAGGQHQSYQPHGALHIISL